MTGRLRRPIAPRRRPAALNTSTTAIKVEIGCEIEDWNNSGSGSGSGGESGDGGSTSDEDDGKIYANLSASGTANCYLIKEAGDYKFKAVQGNTDGTVGSVKSVEVLWESFGTATAPNVGDLISSVSYRDGYIRFSTPATFSEGNAVIAAKNAKGVILWSWHIWCASEGWKEQVYYNDAGTMMDRNLGATSANPGEVGSMGLLYQWGRKDPFLGAASVTDNVPPVHRNRFQMDGRSDVFLYMSVKPRHPVDKSLLRGSLSVKKRFPPDKHRKFAELSVNNRFFADKFPIRGPYKFRQNKQVITTLF